MVATGTVRTGPERDWTVKVDVTGLGPGTTYWYRFGVGPSVSRIGRTRTAPSSPAQHLRIGVATCADWRRGLWNAYARLAERDDLDVVVHLGDYIYENGKDDVRPPDRATGPARRRADDLGVGRPRDGGRCMDADGRPVEPRRRRGRDGRLVPGTSRCGAGGGTRVAGGPAGNLDGPVADPRQPGRAQPPQGGRRPVRHRLVPLCQSRPVGRLPPRPRPAVRHARGDERRGGPDRRRPRRTRLRGHA